MDAATDTTIDLAGIAALHRAGEPAITNDTAGRGIAGTNTPFLIRLYGNQRKETFGEHRRPT